MVLFLRLFYNDAIILWHIFNYKLINNCVAFGQHPFNKVINKLNEYGLGYMIVTNNEELFVNDKSMYDLYLQIALKRYDKQIKQEELIKLLNTILNKDINNYIKIKQYLESLT